MQYEFVIESADGHVRRDERTIGQGRDELAEFWLAAIGEEEQLRIKIYNEDTDREPIGVILLKR